MIATYSPRSIESETPRSAWTVWLPISYTRQIASSEMRLTAASFLPGSPPLPQPGRRRIFDHPHIRCQSLLVSSPLFLHVLFLLRPLPRSPAPPPRLRSSFPPFHPLLLSSFYFLPLTRPPRVTLRFLV